MPQRSHRADLPLFMHTEILTKEQVALLPLIHSFSRSFGLVGGTAVALHLGHRRSIDFDLFSYRSFNNLRLMRKMMKLGAIPNIFVNKKGELTGTIKGVKITFFQYPFAVEYSKKLDSIVSLPDLLTLAAMKAYALGMRAKWKDYVDLYFIMREYHGIAAVIDRTKSIFADAFNQKLFRAQLAYFKDINYSEKVVYMPDFAVSDAIVKKGLRKYSLE